MTSPTQQQQDHKVHQVGLDELHEELDTTPVHAAARAGWFEDLREILLADATQVMALDKYGLTPLHWACDRGEAAIARFLLQHGADVNAVEQRMFKRRPLHFAVLATSEATVLELLAYHANVLVVDYRGWAPIHGAAYNGHVGSLTALLDAGASVVTQLTKRHETALHVAASQGNIEAIELLLKHNSDDRNLLGIKDGDHFTAEEVAARSGFEDVSRLLGMQR
ncbi:hypothetical protein KXD40_007275 [Peronospora effusa]|uniref:Uncharacterized protein n=1 Tax=Peronospora effusa TaxID=542832 RepID=A0A3M6VRX2_9STRA|nr:hypothetical protein DD238_001357 [Peronospora effusa]UIZ29170.1 hypothetical protein KXD40_007275 [Peronospora effusa]